MKKGKPSASIQKKLKILRRNEIYTGVHKPNIEQKNTKNVFLLKIKENHEIITG